MKKKFSGQVAVISGASRGIGAQIAEELAQSGVDIAVGYHTSQQAAAKVVDRCHGFGVRAKAYGVDLRSQKEVADWMRQVRFDLGDPTYVIHSAG